MIKHVLTLKLHCDIEIIV